MAGPALTGEARRLHSAFFLPEPKAAVASRFLLSLLALSLSAWSALALEVRVASETMALTAAAAAPLDWLSPG